MQIKNQNIVVIAMASALVFALAPVTKANITLRVALLSNQLLRTVTLPLLLTRP
jgi:hypothetical protein